MSKLTTTAAALMSGAIAMMPFANANAGSAMVVQPAQPVHPLLQDGLNVDYGMAFCRIVADSVGKDPGVFLCGAALKAFEKELAKGPQSDAPFATGAGRDGKEYALLTVPYGPKFTTATIAFCVQNQSGKVVANGGITPSDGAIYHLPINNASGGCDAFMMSEVAGKMSYGMAWQQGSGAVRADNGGAQKFSMR